MKNNRHSAIQAALLSKPVVFGNEVELQNRVAAVLGELGWQWEREFWLDARSRADFMVLPLPGTLVEVKIEGGLNEILRQLKRYSMFEAVREIVLVCPKPLALPPTLTGKLCRCVAVYQAMI